MHHFITDIQLNCIWEFAHMPQVFYFNKEEFLADCEKEDLPLFDGHDFQQLAELQSQLKKHHALIREFYIDDEINIFTLLSSAFPLDAHTDHSLFDYLKRLDALSTDKLLTGLLYAALSRGLFTTHQENLQSEAEAMSTDMSLLMSWLNSSDYSKEMKWRLLQISQSPKEELQRYYGLMTQLEPLFNQYFEPFKAQIQSDLNALVEKLTTNGPKPMHVLTDGILDDEILPSGNLMLYISYFQPYSIALKVSSQIPVVAWGKYIEVFLAYHQKLKEDALNDHIKIFKNLGDKTRYQVAQYVANGINSTKTLADQLGVTPATISYHLNQLTNAKVLKLESIDGKFQYAINQVQIQKTISELSKHFNLKS